MTNEVANPFEPIMTAGNTMIANLLALPGQILGGLSTGVQSTASGVQFPLQQVLSAPLDAVGVMMGQLGIAAPAGFPVLPGFGTPSTGAGAGTATAGAGAGTASVAAYPTIGGEF